MVQSHLALAAFTTLFLVGAPQNPPESKLTIPFVLKRDEWKAGNPFAAYVEMLRLEKEYEADKMWRTTYWEARGTVGGILGDNYEGAKGWNTAFPNVPVRPVLLKTPLSEMKPMNAIDVIANAARTHNWIMLGEEHLKPQTRSIMIPLLNTLWKQGFRTLAVETFEEAAPTLAAQLGYPTYGTGYYTADPVFSAGIREAIRLGYKLVPYEAREQPKEVPEGDTEFRTNFRETLQAKNLKERIWDKDKNAKVIVWAGREHVLENVPQVPESESVWRPMASEFKKMTGVDPFSVYLATYVEHSERKFERAEYIWATDRGLVKRPTIFMDKGGKPFGDAFDTQVFFPRTELVQGRPDWMMREMGRRLVAIPDGLVKAQGLQLAQVFGAGEPVTAVPIDQTLIRPGEPVPALMLPRGRKCWVRVLNAEGTENGRADVMAR